MSDLQIPHSETDLILQELAKVSQLDGDVVEFGCYAGDTSVLLAQALQASPQKWLWLYDSFAGLPEKTANDHSANGWRFKAGALKADASTVQHKFRKYRLPEPVIKQAWFQDLHPDEDLPSKICFALLDGDFYESIKISLKKKKKKLVPGGIMVVHDYRNPALPGPAKAVNEFLAQNPNYKLRLSASLAIIERLAAS